MKKIRGVLIQAGKLIAFWLVVVSILWFGLAAVYGSSSTSVKESPLYNSPETEIYTTFVIIPIVALLWPIWFPPLYFICCGQWTGLLDFYKNSL